MNGSQYDIPENWNPPTSVLVILLFKRFCHPLPPKQLLLQEVFLKKDITNILEIVDDDSHPSHHKATQLKSPMD